MTVDILERPILRVMICGSVDDGKSTLLGRLLYEKRLIPRDELEAIGRASRRLNPDEEDIDYSLLLDGLIAEREQRITIDVAYRYFSTARRSFIVADTPGHEQYTRNMVTGASNSDAAVILVDVRKGLLTQSCRHAAIASLLQVRHVVLAVNKMDLVDFDRGAFEAVSSDFSSHTTDLDFQSLVAIPTAARRGDNVTTRSVRMPWYQGPVLLDYLESLDIRERDAPRPFRMVVQWINRPDDTFRGVSGRIASGALSLGDPIIVAEGGRASKVERVITPAGDVAMASAPDSVTLTLTDDIDISRGDILSSPDARPRVADRFWGHLIWLGEESLLPGRSYRLKSGTRVVPVSVVELKYRLDVNSLEKNAAKILQMNEIGFCSFATSAPVAFDPYVQNRETGGFIVIDRYSNATVAAGLFAADRTATNRYRQAFSIAKSARAQIKHQRPVIVWFTGLSGAGKSTIANRVEQILHDRGVHTTMLDGDNIRFDLNYDLDFTDADRVRNIRRVGEVTKLMLEAGLIVLCAFISPYRAERRMVRELVEAEEFIEIFVDAPIEVCIARDPKGLYKRALSGEIENFTGVSQLYESPENPDLTLFSAKETVEVLAQRVVEELRRRGIFFSDSAF